MAKVYGICRYDFDVFYLALEKFGHSVSVNDMSGKTVILTDLKFLVTNLDEINRTRTKLIFVLGSPEIFKGTNITCWDCNKKLTKVSVNALRKTDQGTVQVKRIDYIKRYLKATKPSVIKNIQTLLYRIKDKETRAKVRNRVFTCLQQGQDIAQLEASLISVAGGSQIVNSVVKILDTDEFTNTRAALVQAKSSTVKQAAKQFKVSSFDINYILAFKPTE